MPEFVILRRRADHADAVSIYLEAGDIDQAASAAIAACPDDEYVCGVWQRDTPHDLIGWHAAQQDTAL
jgi:hypothetical protein